MESILDDDSIYWLMHCAAEGRNAPDRMELTAQIERLAKRGYVEVSEDASLYALGSDQPSKGVWLTAKGTSALRDYGERFKSEIEEQRAIEFVTGYVQESAEDMPFRAIVPGYLPSRFGILPNVEMDKSAGCIYLTYYGGEDHFIFVQGAEERHRPDVTAPSQHIRGVPLFLSERQETSLWVSSVIRWKIPPVHYRLSFDWLNQLSTERPEREPIRMTDEMRAEGLAVVDSLIAEAQSLAGV
jgi:hypothetical protein